MYRYSPESPILIWWP